MRKFFNNQGQEVDAADATWAVDLEWDEKGALVSAKRYYTDKYDPEAAVQATLLPAEEMAESEAQ